MDEGNDRSGHASGEDGCEANAEGVIFEGVE